MPGSPSRPPRRRRWQASRSPRWKSGNQCGAPFAEKCKRKALAAQVSLEPCFYLHWGDGAADQIEEHDTEVFYITVCNPFRDIRYRGLQITAIWLVPSVQPRDKALIVPDRLVDFGCLEPCSCQTREFALIARANDTAGNYQVAIEYCYEGIEIANSGNRGTAMFAIQITDD